jgi:hypothetical protein
MDEIYSRLFLLMGFGIQSMEPIGFAIRALSGWLLELCF